MKRIATNVSAFIYRSIPDAFAIAILLTFIAFASAILVEGSSPIDVTRWWGEGLWALLAFTMQIVVILVGGYMLAHTKPVDSLLTKATSRLTTPRKAIFFGTLITGLSMWFNWGFGIVVAGIISLRLWKSVPGLRGEYMLASAFSTIGVYGVGLGGSIPLLLATDDHFMVETIGIIPLSETIFRPAVLVACVLIIVGIAALNSLIHPKVKASDAASTREKELVSVSSGVGSSHASGAEAQAVRTAGSRSVDSEPTGGSATTNGDQVDDGKPSFADRLNNTRVLGIALGALGLIWLGIYFFDGGNLDLNVVNTALLFLSILFFMRPNELMEQATKAVKTAGGVIVQYPLYAGIMGVLTASGLGMTIAHSFATFSNAESLPFISFIAGGFMNIFTPSAGGQWALQGPPMIEAAFALGADNSAVALGVTVGDMWTTVFHPFWLLPALGIVGLRVRDVLGLLLLNGVYVGLILTGLMLGVGYGLF